MSKSCNQCGAEVPSTAPNALCPACLLEQGKSTAIASEECPAPMRIGDLQEKFPQLEILEFIGSGGMGGVYKARQPQLERAVALKVIRIGDEPERHERFLREGKALAQLNHPHIVQVYDSGVKDGLGYFIMEYVDGQSLQQVIQEEEIAPEEAEDFVLQLCEALQFAHDRGITHRDIKPANILVAADGQVKIADFGLAKALDIAPSGFELTLSREQVGTPYYMAPEQRMPTSSADHRADLYALGVVYYEMLTRRLPIGRVDKPSVHCEVDPRVDDLVLTAMDTDPDLRPNSARAMKERLEEIARSPHRRRTSKETVAATEPRAHRLGRAAVWIVGTSTLLGLALGGLGTLLFPKRALAEGKLRISNPSRWASEDMPERALKSDPLLVRTAQSLDLPRRWEMGMEKVVGKLRARRDVLVNGEEIRLQYEDSDESMAQSLVDQYAGEALRLEGSFYEGRVTLQMGWGANDFNIFRPGPRVAVPTTFVETEMKIMTSKGVLYEVIENLKLEEAWGLPKPDAFKKLFGALDVREERGTDLVTITYWDADRNKAANIASAVALAYRSRRMEIEKDRSSQALETLQKQLSSQSDKVEEARLKMLDLAERYRIVGTDDLIAGKGTILMSSMHNTYEKKASLSQLNKQLEKLKGLEGEEMFREIASFSLGEPDFDKHWPAYRFLLDQRQALLDSGLGKKHPEVKLLSERIVKREEEMANVVEGVREELSARRDALAEARSGSVNSDERQDESMNERRKIAEYSEASKEYELQKNMFANMQAKFATEQIDLTMPKVPITIHEDAEVARRKAPLPLEKVSEASIVGYRGPKPKHLLLGMSGIGLLLGLLLIHPIASRLERRRA